MIRHTHVFHNFCGGGGGGGGIHLRIVVVDFSLFYFRKAYKTDTNGVHRFREPRTSKMSCDSLVTHPPATPPPPPWLMAYGQSCDFAPTPPPPARGLWFMDILVISPPPPPPRPPFRLMIYRLASDFGAPPPPPHLVAYGL